MVNIHESKERRADLTSLILLQFFYTPLSSVRYGSPLNVDWSSEVNFLFHMLHSWTLTIPLNIDGSSEFNWLLYNSSLWRLTSPSNVAGSKWVNWLSSKYSRFPRPLNVAGCNSVNWLYSNRNHWWLTSPLNVDGSIEVNPLDLKNTYGSGSNPTGDKKFLTISISRDEMQCASSAEVCKAGHKCTWRWVSFSPRMQLYQCSLQNFSVSSTIHKECG